MKKILRCFLLITFILYTSAIVKAQFVIKIKPTAPIVVRPVAPSPRHIWVDAEWMWHEGRYQYVNGYWATAPQFDAKWVPGHWKNTRRGWIWKPGHWRRR